jgi:predicted Zn-dependent protease
VQVGDLLLSADGVNVAETRAGGRASALAMQAAAAILDTAFADGEALLEVQRGEARLRLPVRAEQGCLSRFQLEASGESNAGADGEWVRVTTQLTRSVRNADEFAAIVAHEFAHNVLGHRGRSAISALLNFRAVRAQEIEADRLSVWLLDGAGYDPRGAVIFWRRFGPAETVILAGPTHPGWRRRVAIIEAEIAAMERLKRANPAATPPFLRVR